MRNSVREELKGYLLELVNTATFNDENKDDWHHIAFNEDYYIIGYYQASEWLKKHNIDTFEAIGVCQEWEENVLGEKQKSYDNSETTVNMYVYVMGEELLNELDAENIDELKEKLED